MSRTALAVALAVLSVAALALGPAAAAAAPSESASFGDNYVVVTRGDTTTITVSHSAPANLTIGSQNSGFKVRVHLGGAGTDTITFHTYNTTAADPAAFLSTGGELQTRPLETTLEAGRYQMSVSIDGVTEAVGNIDVEPRGDTTGRTGVAPSSVDFEEASPSDVYGQVTPRGTVARGDYAAFVVNESGLEWAFGGDVTASALQAAGLRAEVVETDPEPNTVADEFSGGDLRVVSMVEKRDRFVVLWDTSQVAVHRNSNNTYSFRLTLTADSELVTQDQRLLTKRVRVVKPRVSIAADPSFTLAPWDDRQVTVHGETNLAPGTSLDVRALQTSPRALLWSHVVDVTDNGTFAATFDFEGAIVPNSFPLWVREYRGRTEHQVRLTAANASLAFDAQQVRDGAVVVRNVTLSHGGFLRVAGNNTTFGTTDFVRSGHYETVRVPLEQPLESSRELNVTAFADVNRSGELDAADVPYNVSGSIVRDNATVVPADGVQDVNRTTNDTVNGTANATTTATTTARTTLAVEESAPLTPVPASAGGGSGGFVPLSPLAAVVGLAAGALLAWRR
ncbi:MAG: BGTF surface domain-containing protein [Halobacterium sp.]